MKDERFQGGKLVEKFSRSHSPPAPEAAKKPPSLQEKINAARRELDSLQPTLDMTRTGTSNRPNPARNWRIASQIKQWENQKAMRAEFNRLGEKKVTLKDRIAEAKQELATFPSRSDRSAAALSPVEQRRESTLQTRVEEWSQQLEIGKAMQLTASFNRPICAQSAEMDFERMR
ncbi:hypothetical protein [Lignipirellula cremea]|uniref:Chromosome partition protein Smc n=1 Tax=Lignipirellula cremea TaxID=2528010 RepID=A0A518E3E4_9BACT|nr:hypothetical protein [Lignipirellula cremea]QDU98604.1 hypothetical protein Pla8534_64750 [Lignipirellula cremea]